MLICIDLVLSEGFAIWIGNISWGLMQVKLWKNIYINNRAIFWMTLGMSLVCTKNNRGLKNYYLTMLTKNLWCIEHFESLSLTCSKFLIKMIEDSIICSWAGSLSFGSNFKKSAIWSIIIVKQSWFMKVLLYSSKLLLIFCAFSGGVSSWGLAVSNDRRAISQKESFLSWTCKMNNWSKSD